MTERARRDAQCRHEVGAETGLQSLRALLTVLHQWGCNVRLFLRDCQVSAGPSVGENCSQCAHPYDTQ